MVSNLSQLLASHFNYPARNVSTLDGKSELFDVVILTMPVPQVMQLKGEIQCILGRLVAQFGDIYTKNLLTDSDKDLKRKLEKVEYSSRFALGLFYEKDAELKLPADVGYVNDHPVFRYFAIDNRRRNRRTCYGFT